MDLVERKTHKGLSLYFDQGSQFYSKEFTEFCVSQNIVQSMSKAGFLGDNAVMERYYNTFNSELITQY